MSWDNKLILYKDVFDQLKEWMEAQVSSGVQEVELSGHGVWRINELKYWIIVLSLIGHHLLNYSRALALMDGRDHTEWQDHMRAGFIILNGHMLEILGRTYHSDDDGKFFPNDD